jgi:tetratricopeptide (TPR) repeat protein
MNNVYGIAYQCPASAGCRKSEIEKRGTLLADESARLQLEADALVAQGSYTEGLARYRLALALRRNDGELNYKAAFAAWRAGKTAEAGNHFREAARLSPHHPAPHQSLALWCLSTGDVDSALLHSDRALSIAPAEPEVLSARAAALAGAGQVAEAWSMIRRVLAGRHWPPRTIALYGRLAHLYGAEQDALERTIRMLERQALCAEDRAQLHFTAAALFDRRGCYDQAFGHASAAHAAHHRPYDPALICRQVEHHIEYFTPRKLHDLPCASHGSLRPIFIIGMPRSGTSLIEQVLASHPDVYGGGELGLLNEVSDVAAVADVAGRGDYPGCLDALSLRGCNELAGRYLAGLSRLNATARYVTDKMPTNFFFLGAIRMLFPDCHVIHCVRDPLDTCLSCYMTDFAVGHEFAQDLARLGQFFTEYRRLVSHWRDTLNYPMIEVQYEQLVSNPEDEMRWLLEHLDLPWDSRCLRFHENPRPVATASALQVRRPLYRGSIGRWRHYQTHLAPLIETLQEQEAGGKLENFSDIALAQF